MGGLLAVLLALFAGLFAFLLVVAMPVAVLMACEPLQEFVFSQPFLLEAYLKISFWPYCSVRRRMLRFSKRYWRDSGHDFLYIDGHRAGAHLLSARDLPPASESGLVVRCVVISDTHGLQDDLPSLPSADVLVLCGNLLLHGQGADEQTVAQLAALDRWLASHGSAIPERVVVAGCHDTACEELGAEKVQKLLPSAIYLQDEQRTLQCGLLIFGSPRSIQQSELPLNRAFQSPVTDELPEAVLNTIPDGLDLLVTHGSPLTGTTREYIGSKRLLQKVKALRPTAHVFGHCREGFGAKSLAAGRLASERSVVLCNCTNTDGFFAVVNPPIVLDIPIQSVD